MCTSPRDVSWTNECTNWGCQEIESDEVTHLSSVTLERIGKYRILRQLGCGGMGIVYLAEDPTLSRKVALKVLYPSLLTDTGFLARFRTEAQSIAALESPYIVRINSMNEFDEGQVAIDMEYVEGGVIAPHLSDPLAIARVAFHTLEGLGACHRLGVIHRDIKPNNLLISCAGITKIADFGLATAISDHLETSIARGSSSGFFMGTPRYAPPEAWEGGTANPTWDLYSLGMVLYEGITKRTVYDGTSPLAIAKQISSAPPSPVQEFAPNVSEAFGTLIDRMVSHDPAARPQNVDEALTCLNESSESKALNLREPPTVRVSRPISISTIGKRSFRWLQSGKLRYAMIGSLALPVVIAALLFASQILNELNTALVRGDLTEGGLGSAASSGAASATNSAGEGASWRTQPAVYAGNELGEKQSDEYVWLIDLSSVSQSGSAVLSWGYGIGSVSLVERDLNTYSIIGNWAAYREPTGRSLQVGSLSGTLQATSDGRQIVVSLEWNDGRSRLDWGTVQTLTRSAGEDSTAEYWLRVEEMEWVQPLIYTELIPRSLKWVNEIESNFGGADMQRTEVPALHDIELPALNGNLVEEIWQTRYYTDKGRIGELSFWNGPNNSRCILRFAEESLYIGIQTPFPESNNSRVNLSLAPSFAGALSEMPTYHVTWNDSKRKETRLSLGDREAPWTCDWKFVSMLNSGQWQCEIEIPFAQLVGNMSEIIDQVFRLNLSLESIDKQGTAVGVGNIGSSNVDTVEHGAVIRLTDRYE